MNMEQRIAAGGLIFKHNSILLVIYRDSNAGTYLVGPGDALKDDENIIQAIERETKGEPSEKTFVPNNFVALPTLEIDQFRLRMLSVEDAQKNYEAVMESVDLLHTMGCSWPRLTLPLPSDRMKRSSIRAINVANLPIFVRSGRLTYPKNQVPTITAPYVYDLS